MTTQEILDAALSLADDEQILLVEQLLDRMSPDAELAEDALEAELERRRADFERGTAAEIPWSEVRDEAV